MGRGRPKKPFVEDQAEQVEKMAAAGIKMEDIAFFIGMDAKTCRNLYHDNWRRGKIRAHKNIAAALYTKALKGDTASMIFWAKTQMGWRETLRVDNTSSDGSMATGGVQTPERRAQAFMQMLDGMREAEKEQDKSNGQ